MGRRKAYPWDPDLNNQDLFQSQKIGMAIMTSFAASAWPAQIAKLPDKFEMDVFPNPLGPTGKHASQVSSDGKGVSMASKNADKAWIVLSRLYTGTRHGIEATPPRTIDALLTVLFGASSITAATDDIAKSSDSRSLNFM